MQKINIIQFLPYFPPHKWWVETVWEEIWINWIKNNFWDFINVITDFEQGSKIEKGEIIIFENEIIWYKENNIIHLVIPSFEIINNFPVYKFWNKKIIFIFKYLRKYLKENKEIKIISHTRFFTTSFFAWIFAKYYKLKWIHIEHWSDYVKLSSNLKNKISYFYDRVIWKRIFNKADKIVAISEACKKFIQNEFIDRGIEIIYNGINFEIQEKKYNWEQIKIWFVWRLVKLKWVDLLLEAFKNLSKKYSNLELEIVWDWEEKEILEKYVLENNLKNVKFLWFKNREYVKDFLSKTDILINPSFQEWLPTTVLEWLLSKCVVVATDVWWTKEISSYDDLIITEKWNLESIEKWIEKAILWYKELSGKSSNLVKEKFKWEKNILNLYNLVR